LPRPARTRPFDYATVIFCSLDTAPWHSARYKGVKSAIFRPERLSNVRDVCYLTYRSIPTEDEVTVERKPGHTWLRIRPSALA